MNVGERKKFRKIFKNETKENKTENIHNGKLEENKRRTTEIEGESENVMGKNSVLQIAIKLARAKRNSDKVTGG
jgi:hypothetical protein